MATRIPLQVLACVDDVLASIASGEMTNLGRFQVGYHMMLDLDVPAHSNSELFFTQWRFKYTRTFEEGRNDERWFRWCRIVDLVDG